MEEENHGWCIYPFQEENVILNEIQDFSPPPLLRSTFSREFIFRKRKKQPKTTSNLAQMKKFKKKPLCLPEDIIREIFSRSSVRALLRFTCLSKSFGNLITNDRNFVYSHLSQAMENNNPLVRVVMYSKTYVMTIREPVVQKFKNTPLSNPMYIGDGFVVGGSCHGLVCFYSFFSGYAKNKFYLWNPALRQIREVLGHPDRPPICYADFIGFFYDSSCQDYKIMSGLATVVNYGRIYSLKNDSWKLINYHLPLAARGCLGFVTLEFNVVLHWICSYKNINSEWGNSVIAFDIVDEKIDEFVIPCFGRTQYYGGRRPEKFRGLGVLNGSMSLLVNCDGISKVWSMKEYGRCESWMMAYKLPHTLPVLRGWIPLELTTSGKIIATNPRSNDGVLFDPETGCLETFKMEEGSEYNRYFVVDYVESLIDPCKLEGHGQKSDLRQKEKMAGNLKSLNHIQPIHKGERGSTSVNLCLC